MLKTYASAILRSYTETIVQASQVAVSQVLKREGPPYFTQNTYHLDAVCEQRLSLYRSARWYPSKFLRGLDLPPPFDAGSAPTIEERPCILMSPSDPEAEALTLLAQSGYPRTPENPYVCLPENRPILPIFVRSPRAPFVRFLGGLRRYAPLLSDFRG